MENMDMCRKTETKRNIRTEEKQKKKKTVRGKGRDIDTRDDELLSHLTQLVTQECLVSQLPTLSFRLIPLIPKIIIYS